MAKNLSRGGAEENQRTEDGVSEMVDRIANIFWEYHTAWTRNETPDAEKAARAAIKAMYGPAHAALTRYGKHNADCQSSFKAAGLWEFDANLCTCGFTAALRVADWEEPKP